MTTESKYKELLSKVHQGVPLEKPVEKSVQKEKEVKSDDAEATAPDITAEVRQEIEVAELPIKIPVQATESATPISAPAESLTKAPEKRKRKQQADYQSLFFTRVDFTHRKPLYITATTHRRLMRIVHLMDESKATIGSYVENIILHHLDMFKEDIDTIYQTNSINPIE